MTDTIFCTQCGAQLDGQARFCSKCGNVTAVPSSSAQQLPAIATSSSSQPASIQVSPQSMSQAYGAAPAPAQVAQTAYPGALPYAGFWLRVGAYLIDVLVLFVPVFVFTLIPFLGIILNIVCIWLYFALPESSES